MEQRRLLSSRDAEIWLTFARAVLALGLALSIVLARRLHLAGFVGTLGMYAVTDGVLAAFSRRRVSGPYPGVEGLVSVLLGLVIMLWAGTERGLLLLFCTRNVLLGGAEIFSVRPLTSEYAGFRPSMPRAYLAYAGLSTTLLSLAFLVAAARLGYGALELYACLSGQLAIWAAFVFGHALMLTKQRRDAREYGSAEQRASWA